MPLSPATYTHPSFTYCCTWLSTFPSGLNLNISATQSSNATWCPGWILSISPRHAATAPDFLHDSESQKTWLPGYLFVCAGEVGEPIRCKEVMVRTLTVLALIPAGFLTLTKFLQYANICWMNSALSIPSVQVSCLVVSDSLWTTARQASLPIINCRSLPKPMSTELVMPSIQPSHPLSSPSPPASIFPSIRVFSNESPLGIRWPKYWSFNFNISPSKEHKGLISFRMDWLDLLAAKGLSRVFSNISSKASILWCSVFFKVQFSHPCMTPGKTISLD